MVTTKLKLLQNQLLTNQLFLVFNKHNLYYLTNLWIEGYVLALTKTKFKILTSSMFAGQLRNYFDNKDIIVRNELKQQIDALNVKSKEVFVDDEDISHKTYEILTKLFEVKFSPIIKNLREVKDDTEINRIRQAAKVAKKVLSEIKNVLKPGITEVEVKNYILRRFYKYNVEPCFEPIVAFDENTSYPHHISSNKMYKKNSLVLVDLGCKWEGYCCDITRMFNVDRNKEVYQKYTVLLELQKKLISMCKPGTEVRNIDSYARQFLKRKGFKDEYLHSTGHGLGLEVHESPRLNIRSDAVLKEGMVVTIEPGIYFERKFGLRIEDDVLCKKTPEILTL
ncbi:MAG: aminopeptidase P family protein [Endomicrobia bacterium]|nr:aminopeptidase P family protein [Endomicrobiia bacterium]MDW8055238.1 M24 family metallopeptidase [Elusimicrobiota bacterium]